jgi:hypothetical protein
MIRRKSGFPLIILGLKIWELPLCRRMNRKIGPCRLGGRRTNFRLGIIKAVAGYWTGGTMGIS